MLRLFMLMYTLASTVLAGSAIVAALTMNLFDFKSVITAAVIGAVAAIPVAWVVAKKVSAA